MSWQAPVLNAWLRLTEKPFLTRAGSAQALRRSLDFKSRLFFHGPRGTSRTWGDLGGAPALTLSPRGLSGRRLIFYIHGGAHVFGSPKTHAPMMGVLARRANAGVVLPRYPLAPEHPFPAAPDHCLAAYLALLDQGIDPADVVIGGDSAGGNLALVLLADLIRTDGPLPAGLFALSPLTDLSFSGDSFASNAAADVVLPATRITEAARGYLNGAAADDPRASPIHADFSGAPPVWMAAGDTEILRDDTLRVAERMRAAGVGVDLEIARDLPHVWTLFHNLLPEANATLDALAAWIRAQTGASDATR